MDKKWNLQDIKPVNQRKRTRPRQPTTSDVATEQPAVRSQADNEAGDGTMRIAIENGTKKSNRGLIIGFTIFFLVLGAAFFLSYLSSGAVLTVWPRHREPTVNAVFEAFRTPQVGELSYELLVLEAEGERQVTATGQEEVQDIATGEITIYKNTPGTERLIKNTRFESPDGKVFRITESAVVPGAVENSAGELVPGSIRAKVFADSIGEEYNLPAGTTFTVPGFKEGGYTDLYNAISAENESAFTGGFNGVKLTIDEKELETAKQSLQMELRDSLLGRVPGEQPAGFVVFEDATAFSYQSLPAVEYGDDLATIKEKATLQIPIFKAENFASYIAAATVPGYEDEPVRIENTTDLTFTYTSATTSTSDIGNLDSISFKLVGKPQIIWSYDEGKLKTDLLGAPKTALNTILAAYPAIEKGKAVVRPFWKRTYPTNLEKITIEESLSDSQ